MQRYIPQPKARLAIMALAGLCLAAACKQQRQLPDAGPDVRAAAPPTAVTRDPALTRLSHEALKVCTVTGYGVRSCEGDVLARLTAREQALGTSGALMTYCLAQGDQDRRARALAASRVDHLARPKPLAAAADQAVQECLINALTQASPGANSTPLIRAAAYLATARQQEKELLDLLATLTSGSVRSAGYGALWANGRLRVLAPLEKLLATSKDVPLKVAVVRGLARGTSWNKAEQKRLCALLAPLMKGDEVSVAGAAAERVASGCGEAMAGEVLGAAETMLKRGVLDLSYVNAVNALKSPSLKGEHRARMTILLTRVVTGAYPGLVRSTALRNLHAINAEAGRLLARRHRLDNSHLVASSARRILDAAR